MKKIIAMIMALAMVFALAACAKEQHAPEQPSQPVAEEPAPAPEQPAPEEPAPETPANTDPIKIGHLCDLTGVEAMTGKQAQEALDNAVKYVGTIAGRPIEVYHQDTKSDTSAAVDAARTLAEEFEVDVILGPSLIGHKGAVANFAKDAEIPVIYYNPTPEMMIKGNEWVIGTAGANPQMPTVMADYVYNELGWRKVVTLTKDDTGGKSYMDPFVANFTALGGEVLGQAWAPSADNTDYASYLTQIVPFAEEADGMIAWTSAGNAIQLWNVWYSMGLHETLPIAACFHGAFTDSFVCDALAGQNPAVVEEILGSVAPMTWGYNLENEACQAFVEWYKENNDGVYPIANNLPTATVDALLVLDEAVKALNGDTSDKAALVDAILNVNMQGCEGGTSFAEGANIASKDIHVCKVTKLENGQHHYEVVKSYPAVPVGGLTVG